MTESLRRVCFVYRHIRPRATSCLFYQKRVFTFPVPKKVVSAEPDGTAAHADRKVEQKKSCNTQYDVVVHRTSSVGSNLYLCSLCHPPTHGQDSSTASDAAPRFFFPPPPPPPPTFPLPAREDDARGACEVKIRNGPTLVATRVRLGKRHRASYRACHRRLASHRWRCHRSCHRMPRQREVEPSTWCRLR